MLEVMDLESLLYFCYLGNTVLGLGRGAEVHDSRCQGQQSQEKLGPVSALRQILGTLRGHGPQLSKQDEESRHEKENLQCKASGL